MAGDPGEFGAALPRIPAGSVDSFRTKMLCTTGADVSITAVSPLQARGGLTVTAWGIRPNPFQTGKGVDDLGQVTGEYPASSGFVTAPNAVVTAQCPLEGAEPTDVVSELALSVSKPGAPTASATGFRIDYTIDGNAQHLDIPVTITLCNATDKTGICRTANS